MFYLRKNSHLMSVLSAGGIMLASGLMGPTPAKADCEPDPYIGSICITAASYCPRQYMEMRGQVLDINNYTMLFSLVGDIYGGNGRTNFGLPRGDGRTLISKGQGPGLEYYPLGAYDGVEKRTLMLSQLPPHTHGATFVPTSDSGPTQEVAALPGSLDQPSDGDYKGATTKGSSSIAAYVSSPDVGTTVKLGGVDSTMSPASPTTLSTAGTASAALDTVQPQVGLRYCIAYDGVYPRRP